MAFIYTKHSAFRTSRCMMSMPYVRRHMVDYPKVKLTQQDCDQAFQHYQAMH
jgi:hypothetical protein